MKTAIVTIALSLICAVSFAKSVDSVAAQAAYQARTGVGPEFSLPFMSAKSRADVIAELKAAPRLPAHVGGSEHDIAHAMYMSGRSRDDVRAEARMARRLDNGLDSLYRN